MACLFMLLAAIGLATTCVAKEPVSLAESFLHEGDFAEGETALLVHLDANPGDDEARFGLGVIQFFRAVENLGQALYEYGAVSENATEPFLRLPVPQNPDPAEITHAELGRVLELFAADLARAEATLADIEDDNVKLRLRLADITLDFTGTGEQQTQLLELLNKLNGGPLDLQKANPDFRIHFDRGDVAWLRAYCHALSALAEAYGAVDVEPGFSDRVARVFPRVRATPDREDEKRPNAVKIADAPHLRRMRLHLVAVCKLNRETWRHIRSETDDDFEWLSHAKQTDQLGLPLSEEQVNAWLAMLEQLEGLLTGQRLMPNIWVRMVDPNLAKGKGVNFRKVLDDPPTLLLDFDRIRSEGVDEKYLEDEAAKPAFDMTVIWRIPQLFSGPFGIARAVRLN
ncbi:hypothetical protein NG895_28465 [Aeoliella sp. ICT_H6.2]|uniref:Uncharacterized protein n=1 Tax=Aeoliella straminimaris TaxID=2954799 RepID=A0A9X2FGD4_9BACT|nr:hypothetical protein [Aeoliella straminimaris]MCO6047858.1 hypothetical protein [Aeoliella straminimaris]